MYNDDIGLYRWSRRLLITVATVLAAAILAYLHHFRGGFSADHARWGEFGDYVGGLLNPALAFCALIVLLQTLQLQARELRQSLESLRLQNFERTFFEMVRLHHDIIRDLDLGTNQATVGRDCFRIFCRRLRSTYERSEGVTILERIVTAYGAFHAANQHEVGHYFRNFYRIMKFVDESNVGDKNNYAGILRAQMSSYELVLLFYGTLHPIGERLRPLVEGYALLDNLDLDLLFNPGEEIQLYSEAAYGEQDTATYRSRTET